MSSTMCGRCNEVWHQNRDSPTGFCGQVWTQETGYHRWQAPSKEQIAQRLRKRYGLV